MPKISALPPMATADGDDEAPIVDDSVATTKKFTLSTLLTWLTGGGRIPYLKTRNIYTSSTTWTKPAGMTGSGFVIVTVIAGGGGGGGAANTTAAASAGGGGAGGQSIKKIAAASLGSTETVTVGAAGTGATAGNNAGGTGGNSAFGTHATANGGTGGAGMQSEAGSRVSAGGAGGTAASGDINIQGADGSYGHVDAGWADTDMAGGDTILGTGGRNRTGSSLAGVAARGYGAGGGGGYDQGANTARAGGAGGAGIVIVEEYY